MQKVLKIYSLKIKLYINKIIFLKFRKIMNNKDFDIVIIGSGYRAMITAYMALKKNKKF